MQFSATNTSSLEKKLKKTNQHSDDSREKKLRKIERGGGGGKKKAVMEDRMRKEIQVRRTCHKACGNFIGRYVHTQTAAWG